MKAQYTDSCDFSDFQIIKDQVRRYCEENRKLFSLLLAFEGMKNVNIFVKAEST